MKLTRKLIPAFVMLLVSAVLMSTASFAWFAMNTQVTASGMEVKAKADAIFLEISGPNDGSNWSTAGTAMASGQNAELYPSAHADFTSKTAADVNSPANWYYKHATKLDQWEEVTGDGTALSNFTGYVFEATFKVRLNSDMVQEAANLRVTAVDLPESTGITLVLVYDDATDTNDKIHEFDKDYNATDADTGKVLLATMGADEVAIKAYIYIDGNNTNVYTNNVEKLAGAVTFTLAASAKS